MQKHEKLTSKIICPYRLLPTWKDELNVKNKEQIIDTEAHD